MIVFCVLFAQTPVAEPLNELGRVIECADRSTATINEACARCDHNDDDAAACYSTALRSQKHQETVHDMHDHRQNEMTE